MRKILLTSLLLLTTPAMAQQPQPQQPKFIPFMVDEQAYTTITNALLELKVREGLPILNWINALEQRAQAEALKVTKPPEASK